MAKRTPPAALDHEPQAVTYARKLAGLTMTDLAAFMGVSLSLISEIESGTRNATPQRIMQMVDILGCPRVVLERKYPGETPVRAHPQVVVYARHRAGLTQDGLAALLGVPPELIADIEAGRKTPPPYVADALIQELARALNCPPVVLGAPVEPAVSDEVDAA
jgi:transcriptional regulator with XRE-family HTH domain